jgi:uncharacterized phage-like protein YoqJ
VRAVTHLCGFYPAICLTTEEKVRKTPQSGQPKSASWDDSKNKFEKLVHLVGFIIRIYHDARSSERQIKKKSDYLLK